MASPRAVLGVLGILGVLGCGPGEGASAAGATDSESTAAVNSDESTAAAPTGGEAIAPADLLFLRPVDSSLWSFRLGDAAAAPFAAFALERVDAAAFSPDGGRVAVAYLGDDMSQAIDVVTSDQTKRWSLADEATLGFQVGLDGLAWSPDGATIAVSGSKVDGGVLAIVDAGSGAGTILVEFPNGSFVHRPVWSPDGSLLVVSVHDGAQSDITLHEVASGETRLIDATPDQEVNPVFSPDGTRLAFGSDRGGVCTLLLHDLATGVSTAAAPSWGGSCWPRPDWTPVGDRIAYARNEARELRVFTVGLADDHAIAEISFPGGPTRIRWSPDGEAIAFEYASDPYSELEVVTASGDPVQRLGEGDGVTWRPGP